MKNAFTKKISIIALFLASFFVFYSCAQVGNDVNPNASEENMPVLHSERQIASLYMRQERTKFDIEEIDISAYISDGMSLGCITSADKNIYFEICRMDPATGNYINSTVYQFDTVLGDTKEVISIENDEGFFSNELICIKDYLFWVYRDSDELNICYFCLTTKERGALNTYSTSVPDIVLAGDDQFLTWYVPNDQGISLFYYDIYSKETSCLTNNAATDSPYTRAYVNGGVIAYLENREDGHQLVVYDLTAQKESYSLLILKEFMLTRLQANDSYTAYTEGYARRAPLFILSREMTDIKKIIIRDSDYSIFSCHLFGEYIVINSNSTQEVFLVSIPDETYQVFNIEMSIIQTGVSPNGLFYGCNPAENTIVYMKIGE